MTRTTPQPAAPADLRTPGAGVSLGQPFGTPQTD